MAYLPPPGAVDAHCHVFGPGERFPYAPGRRYTPADAPKEALWVVRDRLGLARNVVVQATCHGTDNRALVDALDDAEGRARGVACVAPDASDAELRELAAAGVRGLRFNFLRRLVERPPGAELAAIAERIAPLGWHVVLYLEPDTLRSSYEQIASLPAPLVIDHMGSPDVAGGPEGAGFQRLLTLMRERPDVWCKVSCPERFSRVGPPGYADVVPFARQLVESFPDRVLWGTDWPHPNMTSHVPDDAALLDLVPAIAATPDLQHRLLVANPMRLYWPEAAVST